MANTKIEWTEATWNPVTGCTKISDGCANCYAANFARRLQAMGNIRYANGFNVSIHEDLIDLPKTWKSPKKIFVNSMSDIFHDEIPDEVILRIFQTMNECPQHQFQVLTKRPERLIKLNDKIQWTKNIWMGVTIENDKYLSRADLLRETNAYIKFISAEPLLGSIQNINLQNIDWLIVGGESGPHSRQIDKTWVEELQGLAQKNNVAFFFKQWGGFNKKKNGKLLNGKIIQEYPNK
jgi:protein gp37